MKIFPRSGMARKRVTPSERKFSRTTHLLSLIVITVTAALAFGFPIDPLDYSATENAASEAASNEPVGASAGTMPSQRIALALPLPPRQAEPESDPKSKVLPTAPETATTVGLNTAPATDALLPVNAAATASIDIHAIDDGPSLENAASDVVLENGWHKTKVHDGDTMLSIFSRLGVRTEDLYTIIKSSKLAKSLERVHPNKAVEVRMSDAGQLMELIYVVNPLSGVRVLRQDDGFETSAYKHETETHQAVAAGVVESSLYKAAMDTDLTDKSIARFGEIFGWKIDFSHDVRPGDSFAVVFEEKRFEGQKVDDGDILAAEFTNRGKRYRALGLRDAKGRMHYYTPEGRSLKQGFMRNPVDFTRISSHFRPNRWHPVLGKKRPHRGVDYAAPTGTPIMAAGDGRVVHRGRKGGYGNTVIIDHGRGYTTLYAHMSRFKKGVASGSQVEQGDVIGYVGSTGLATGPHLHYEFRINGQHKNPVTVKLPATPIDPTLQAKFKREAGVLLALLDQNRPTQVADAAQ